MKAPTLINLSEKSVEFGGQIFGNVMTIFIVTFLIVAWALTGPLFGIFDQLSSHKNKSKMKGTI